ncbi:f-box-like domain-containing protein [Ditylenchus destructor]|uniref:F-box-like domain-containing protein n=1 Tax=Ditylenchus destructor TaxID=166010 RepID=A0AAD4QWP9_9BILA|nr:f-box-like domain-containing protein [Ditylenchus destructor]
MRDCPSRDLRSHFMEDDVLIDVFRPLSRRQLSQSIALVCRRFHRLSNSPYLPNLHVIWSLWTLPIGRPRGRQKFRQTLIPEDMASGNPVFSG